MCWSNQQVKQFQNLLVSSLSGMIILWTDVQCLAIFVLYIFPFFVVVLGESVNHIRFALSWLEVEISFSLKAEFYLCGFLIVYLVNSLLLDLYVLNFICVQV